MKWYHAFWPTLFFYNASKVIISDQELDLAYSNPKYIQEVSEGDVTLATQSWTIDSVKQVRSCEKLYREYLDANPSDTFFTDTDLHQQAVAFANAITMFLHMYDKKDPQSTQDFFDLLAYHHQKDYFSLGSYKALFRALEQALNLPRKHYKVRHAWLHVYTFMFHQLYRATLH